MATYAPFAAGQKLTASDLNSLIFAETMPWTDLASLGTFATNFSAGSRTPRMRKLMEAGTEVWEFQGNINAAAFAAASTLTMFTLNVGYRVLSEREFAAQAATAGHYPIRLGFMTNGTVTGSIPAAGPTTTSVVWIDCRITNPLS